MRPEVQRAGVATGCRTNAHPTESRQAERSRMLRAHRAAAALLIMLCSASSVYAQERPILDRAVEIANGSALVAHAADLSSTLWCLSAKTCTEANPLLAPHVADPKKVFALKMGTALASYWVKTKTKLHQPKWTLTFASAETVAFSLIAAHNYRVHQKAQGR